MAGFVVMEENSAMVRMPVPVKINNDEPALTLHLVKIVVKFKLNGRVPWHCEQKEKEMEKMFFKKYGDIVVGIFFMILSAILIAMARALPKSQVMDIGPDFMPMVIGVITFILAAILTVMSLANFKRHVAEIDPASLPECDYVRVLSSIILVLIYVFALQPVGFIVTTLVFLPLQMLVLAPEDSRNKKGVIQILIIDVVFTLFVFMLFRYAFKIVLPAGIFTI